MVRKIKYPKGGSPGQFKFKDSVSDYEVVSENKLLLEHMEAIGQLCTKHHVDKLYLFGSAAKGEPIPLLSDIDFLVKFKEFSLKYYFENFLTLKESLENILKRKVDLIEQQTLKNPVLIRSIEKSKILIYG